MLYLSIVRDLFNGEILDWKLSNNLNSNLCYKNLVSAWNYSGKPKNVIIHSDQGSSYTSLMWKDLCESMHMVISMSRNGECETWFSSFKKECIYLYQRNELNLNNIYEIVSNYIDFYNFVRPRISQRKTPFEQRMEFFNKKIFFSVNFNWHLH